MVSETIDFEAKQSVNVLGSLDSTDVVTLLVGFIVRNWARMFDCLSYGVNWLQLVALQYRLSFDWDIKAEQEHYSYSIVVC